MFTFILSFFLKLVGGRDGILGSVLTHYQELAKIQLGKEKLQTDIAIKNIEADIALNAARQAIVVAQLGHPVAWIPRALAEITAVFYFMLIVIDSIFQLPGSVDELPATTAAVMATIFAGMFLSLAANRVQGAVDFVRDRLKR